jgi:hypothetical protein
VTDRYNPPNFTPRRPRAKLVTFTQEGVDLAFTYQQRDTDREQWDLVDLTVTVVRHIPEPE